MPGTRAGIRFRGQSHTNAPPTAAQLDGKGKKKIVQYVAMPISAILAYINYSDKSLKQDVARTAAIVDAAVFVVGILVCYVLPHGSSSASKQKFK